MARYVQRLRRAAGMDQDRRFRGAETDPAAGGRVARFFASLRHRNFRLFFFGSGISAIGSRMQTIGQSWLVLELTHSAWQLGVVGALQALPILLFSLAGGLIADRWPKRHILLVTQSLAMAQSFLLWALVAAGEIHLWQLYLLVLLLGVSGSVGAPALRSLIVELVGREDLPNAVGLYSSAVTVARIAGPALGGVVIAAADVKFLFLVNALSFAPSVAALALMRRRDMHAGAAGRGGGRGGANLQSLRAGARFVLESPALGILIGAVGLVLLFGSNFGVVLPLLATGTLHAGPAGYGFLSAAGGAGALGATLWLAWSNRQPDVRSVLLGMTLFSLLEIAFAASRFFPLSLVLLAGVDFAESAFAFQSITALQALTPDELRGRVTSVQVLFFDGSLPLGYLLMGWLSGLYGPSSAISIGAVLCLAVSAAGWARRKEAEGNAAELARLAR